MLSGIWSEFFRPCGALTVLVAAFPAMNRWAIVGRPCGTFTDQMSRKFKQISREFSVSDQGIDMEIEFTDDAHEATGAKLYLQLKSGDSYTRKRRSDGAEIFTLKKQRHAEYWMAQAFPVLLVIRNSEGEVRWMEVRDWLKRASENGKKAVKQIVFEGERFDVMSVRRWRERVLGSASPRV